MTKKIVTIAVSLTVLGVANVATAQYYNTWSGSNPVTFTQNEVREIPGEAISFLNKTGLMSGLTLKLSDADTTSHVSFDVDGDIFLVSGLKQGGQSEKFLYRSFSDNTLRLVSEKSAISTNGRDGGSETIFVRLIGGNVEIFIPSDSGQNDLTWVR